jgi:hypothetical protein
VGGPVPPWLVNPQFPPAPLTQQPYTPAVTEPYTVAYGTGPAGNATPSFTVLQNVAKNDTIVVACSTNSQTTAPVAIGDSQGNPYQLVSIDTNRSPNLALFVGVALTPLTQTVDTLTLTAAGSATTKNLIARGYSNVSAAFSIDQVANPQDANTTSPAISCPALGYNMEWAIAAEVNGAAGGVPPQGSWTGGFSPIMTVGPGPYMTWTEQLVVNGGPLSTSNALAANGWEMLLITLAPVPMINPLSTLPPPGVFPPIAFSPSPLYDTMQGTNPVISPTPPPTVIRLVTPRQVRHTIMPAAFVPSPAPAPPVPPSVIRAARVNRRRPTTPPAPAPGAISQPLSPWPIELPSRQRRWPRRLPTGPQPAPGAVSQPLPATAPERPRRLAKRPAARPAAPPGGLLPPAVQPEPLRRARIRLSRRVAPSVPGQTVVPPAVPAPGQAPARRLRLRPARRPSVPVPSGGVSQPLPVPAPARPRRLAWRAARRPAAVALRPAATAAPRPAEPRRRLPRRWRPSSSQPAPGAVFQPLPVPAQQPKRRQPPRRALTAKLTAAPAQQLAAPGTLRRLPWRLLRRRPPQIPALPPGAHSALASDVLAIIDTLYVTTGVTWDVATASSRWQADSAHTRWQPIATPLRWSATLGDFEPISALSQEAVPVNWISDLAGVTVDPTNPLLVVECAFPVSSGSAVAPAEPVTWYPASWVSGTTSRGFFAECPVGPSTTGPVLTAGQSYDVWSQVQAGVDNTVIKYVGTIRVY